ncbi:flippase [Clostridium estertheticum]|uniref:flippase n=1 Tax=Clostridium estertheticum TaxID=238834 RepID=UPI001C0B88CD|nr:flippase [Clostridium estertheticum]MBU3073205.1 flippase [Clostridium estertheticum]MBU3163554.1 flippase [Clostridium estertheticum]
MNKIVKNFTFMLFGNVFSRIIGVVLTVYLARKFGPTYFGIINFSSAFITYFLILASMGLQSLGILKIAKDKDNIKRNVDTILSVRTILSIIAFSILLIVTICIDKDINTKKMIIITGISILINSFCLDWVFNALQEMKYISYSIMISGFLSFILVFIPLYLNIYTEMYIVPIASAISSIISNIYLIYIYKKKEKYKINFVVDFKQYKELIINAWPFFFSGVFATINCNIDTLMLGFMKGNFEVGLYNSVYKLVNVLTLFVSFIFVPLYPVFIEYYNDKKFDEMSRLIKKVRKLMYIIAIPTLVVAFTVNQETIRTLYGNNYIGASTAFTILISYVAIFFIRELYGYELTAWGLQKKYMNIVLISSMFNIISNLIVIPRYGVNGAAINTLISEIINIALMYRLSRKTLYIKYDNKYILNIVISAIFMTIVIYITKFVSINVFVLVATAGSVYCISILKLKVITVQEIKNVIGGKK